MSFVHLQVRSAYSLLNSPSKIEDLVSKAKALGYKAIALTDENVMYGAVPFFKECKKQNIKPIIGLTVSIIGDQLDSEETNTSAFPLVLLAINSAGYQNLLKISSIVQSKSKAGMPKKWLPYYSKGLLAISPGLVGEIEQSILKDNVDVAKRVINTYKNIFGLENFYLSIQDHGLNEQQMLNKSLMELSKELMVKPVATNDVYYLNKEDSFAHECLIAIKNGNKLSDDDRIKLPSDQYYMKPISNMVELFRNFPEILEETLNISNRCNVEIELGKTALPKYPTPMNECSNDYLEKVCTEGLRVRFGEEIKTNYLERLTYELDVIKSMKFSDYFLIVWDFMKFAHSNGILTGPGRGSAAGSLVAYVLNITDVDPIKYQLLFERFLNPERISMPDIDIDFPDNRRDEVIAYVAQKYGQLHVAQIITFGTLAARAVLRDVGRVMGIPPKEADYISKQIPSSLGITLKQAIKESNSLREYISSSELGKRLYETAIKLEGLPRHTSTHAAGVVISEEPLTNLVPVQEGHNETYLTQYSMDILEELGLLKMDFLGLRNLTILDNILSYIRKETGKRIQLNNIPFNDAKTYELLSSGDTTGIFQLESGGMRKVLENLEPTNIEDIVAVNALYRPGPMENIPTYIERKHGREQIVYPHEDLKEILKTTFGVIVYQEQIMQIAATMAGFSLGEADLLRRAVSKKKKEVLDEEREHFVKGCLNKGYTLETSHSTYDLIVRFANYGFNRSHAVAYSIISYQLAYLKANYPLYFTAALLTSVIGNEDKIFQYSREAKQKGIKLLPPSINSSSFPFTVEKGYIRFSLAAIKGVGVAALREILQVRKQKRYSDLFDFCMRTSTKNVNRKTLEMLISSGTFDEFGEDRATLLASLDLAIEHAELVRPSEDGQFDLFMNDEFNLKPKYIKVDPFSPETKLKFEKEALGFYLSSHPTTPYEPLFKKMLAKPIVELAPSKFDTSVKLGVYITNERTIRTKKGEVMAFLTLSDESGEIEAVTFPTIYRKFSTKLQKGTVVLVEGKIELRDQRQQLIVKNVVSIEELKSMKEESSSLYLKIEPIHKEGSTIQNIHAILKKYHGSTPVIIYYVDEKKTYKLQKDSWINSSEECLNRLKELVGEKNVVLKKH
ncbi:DNA polymerase III subunit alpha [Bacillus luteolus]|uniref:DNA polymerase III subunit alpha n=1 Tax=Litchfieldia luteola TaxID=682179 RepID=A0ABR9QID7_9BACI|nr:DNA polymerase III subunit alpha [Cytobacillus luteolus]MBE4908255.1 DNA polymerase III subunit alpha [Cytobacillus luteolus]MBP1943041.1 DNA polymerase-3 subunit alpha [Cytobacillus luteolus]